MRAVPRSHTRPKAKSAMNYEKGPRGWGAAADATSVLAWARMAEPACVERRRAAVRSVTLTAAGPITDGSRTARRRRRLRAGATWGCGASAATWRRARSWRRSDPVSFRCRRTGDERDEALETIERLGDIGQFASDPRERGIDGGFDRQVRIVTFSGVHRTPHLIAGWLEVNWYCMNIIAITRIPVAANTTVHSSPCP
jgi:hypothetical protein